MDIETAQWRPGSFTKNFSWGSANDGLRQLYEIIRIGFDNVIEDVPRAVFRSRVGATGRPDYIPINFFLFNRIIGGVDRIVVDELVYQAITAEHGPRFDKLALHAFNLSRVGVWKGAESYQRYPAMWAFHYIRGRVAQDFKWDVSRISADDIESFVSRDRRYTAKTARKLATNLNYLYRVGRLVEFADSRVDRWWVDSLFLTLDRLIEDGQIDGDAIVEEQYKTMLIRSDFEAIAGRTSLEKKMAVGHLIRLYMECGSRQRFSEEFVRERSVLRIPDLQWFAGNDASPQGAVHPSNPRILKSIPRACAFLAKYAGFSVINAVEMASFDPVEFIRQHTARALEQLEQEGISPNMTAEELMKLTRDR